MSSYNGEQSIQGRSRYLQFPAILKRFACLTVSFLPWPMGLAAIQNIFPYPSKYQE
jgi:hypothetical protein